ncbi:MAG: hypothetical protein JW820_16445, partial [Spirochaetales bacterium]|nr:hypothetical protein [Spirochaetales bacterium]
GHALSIGPRVGRINRAAIHCSAPVPKTSKRRASPGLPPRIRAGRNACTGGRAYCHLREEERTIRLDRIHSWEQVGRKPAAVPLTPPATTAPQAATAWPQPVRRRRPFRTILVLALLSLGGRWLVINAAHEPSP